MRKILLAVLLVLLTGLGIRVGAAEPPPGHAVDLVMFYGRGCPHCAAMTEFLKDLRIRHPQLRVYEYEVYFDAANARLFERLAAAYKTEILGVPTAFLGESVFHGYAADMNTAIEAQAIACIAQGCASPLARSTEPLPVRSLTFPAVLAGAAVDAINPCAFAVLIILLTTVIGAGGRQQALRAGLAFSASIFISYYLMGLGLYAAVAAAGLVQGIYVTVAVLAILIGLFNLKDYFWYGKWFIMEVPPSWRPRLKGIIQGVTSVPGAFLIGFAVSLFLLPCTSGPYIVILGLLAKTETRLAAMGWLLLYNLVFVAPMLAITFAIYGGFTTVEQAEAWRTRNLQRLHLIAGAIILMLGIAMLAALWLGYV